MDISTFDIHLPVFIDSKRLYCIHSGGRGGVFPVISPPNLNGSRWNLKYKWRVTHTKNTPEIAPWVAPKDAKICFVFVPNTTRTFGNLSFTAFEVKDVNRFLHAYTGKKFRISAQGFCRSPKQLKSVLSRGVCDKATAQTVSNGTISDNGNRFGD